MEMLQQQSIAHDAANDRTSLNCAVFRLATGVSCHTAVFPLAAAGL